MPSISFSIHPSIYLPSPLPLPLPPSLSPPLSLSLSLSLSNTETLQLCTDWPSSSSEFLESPLFTARGILDQLRDEDDPAPVPCWVWSWGLLITGWCCCCCCCLAGDPANGASAPLPLPRTGLPCTSVWCGWGCEPCEECDDVWETWWGEVCCCSCCCWCCFNTCGRPEFPTCNLTSPPSSVCEDGCCEYPPSAIL